MLIKNMGLLISWLIINIKIDHPLITKNTINRKYQKYALVTYDMNDETTWFDITNTRTHYMTMN
jgi:hypothetical protein